MPFLAFVDSRSSRVVLLTSKAKTAYHKFTFRPDDILLFGSESAGVPLDVNQRARRTNHHKDEKWHAIIEPCRFGRHGAWRSTQTNGTIFQMTAQPPIPKNDNPLDGQQLQAQTWFAKLRDKICAEFEAIEAEAGSDARFDYLPWDRENPDKSPGGGGVRGSIKGKVFEKAGVNISTVDGTFSEEFAKSIHGAGEQPAFLCNWHQSCRSYGQPACACRAYEYKVPLHHQTLVWRRRRS